MFPLMRDYEIRREQYRDLLRKSMFERLTGRAMGWARRRSEERLTERHETGMPQVWCVSAALEPACMVV